MNLSFSQTSDNDLTNSKQVVQTQKIDFELTTTDLSNFEKRCSVGHFVFTTVVTKLFSYFYRPVCSKMLPFMRSKVWH